MTDFILSSDDSSEQYNENNILSQLKAVVSASVKRPEIFIDVPERPGVLIRISPNITQGQLRAWRKNAGEDTKRGIDTIKFSAQIIASTTTGILLNDEIVRNEAGVELTFASPEIMQMTNTARPHPDCVVAFFGLEPHIESAAVAIIEASGYGDSVEAVDPTKPSSES